MRAYSVHIYFASNSAKHKKTKPAGEKSAHVRGSVFACATALIYGAYVAHFQRCRDAAGVRARVEKTFGAAAALAPRRILFKFPSNICSRLND